MTEIVTYYQSQMPYKITLIHIKTGQKTTHYKSTTEFLSYDSTRFDAHIQDIKEEKSYQQKLYLS